MKKKILTLLALVLVVATLLVGCQPAYSVSNPDNATDIVTSNGGSVVKHGDYVYFINGTTSYEKHSGKNVYGNVLKGGVMRYKLQNGAIVDGSLELVVPKQVLDSSKTPGIFVYGSKLYYVTPAEIVDKEGYIQEEYLEFCEVGVDGTGNRVIKTLDANTISYVFGKTAFMYLKDKVLYSVSYATGVETEVDKDVVSAIFPTNYTYDPTKTGISSDDCVYYTKANADEVVYSYNEIYLTTVDGSYKAQLAGKDSFTTTSDYTKMYTYTLLKYEGGQLYYTKSYSASSAQAVGTFVIDMTAYAYDETKSITWIATNETKLSIETYTQVNAIGGGRYIYVADSKTKLRNADGSVELLFDKAITVVGESNNTLYYDNGSTKLYKYVLTGVDGPAEKLNIKEDSVTTWLSYEFIDGTIYYVNAFNAQNYLHKYDIVAGEDMFIGKRTDIDIASDVAILIDALPKVDALVEDDEEAIVEAQTAYDALSPAQKALVNNYSTLEELQEALAELKD